MSEPTNRELARFVLGNASQDEAHAIERRSAFDGELAAKLRLLGEVAGGDWSPVEVPEASTPTATKGERPRRKHWSRSQWAAAIAVVCLGTGLSWAGYHLLAPKPLLSDSFDSDWGDRRLWETPRKVVTVEGGHARLFDRGCLATIAEFPGPLDIRLRWRWTDLGGDFLYRDDLSVALRTTGRPNVERPYEVTDGIIVKFTANGGGISMHAAEGFLPLGNATLPSIPMPAGQWLDLRITDDGETISAYISAPNQRLDDAAQPRLSVRVPATNQSRRIAFYNRERVGYVSHESWIDDILIRKLSVSPPAPGP